MTYVTRLTLTNPSVKQKGPTIVARHFGRAPHSQTDLKVQIHELIPLNPDSEEADIFRETRKHFWIHRLRTLQPQGINSMEVREYKRRKKQAVSNPTVPLSNQTRAKSSHSSQ